MKKQLGRKAYYRIELARILVFPLFLVLTALMFQWFGWITPEQAPIVWAVIAIQTAASLLSLAVIAFIEK